MESLFIEFGMQCQTIKDLGWRGLKDKEIVQRIKDFDCIFMTRDKDFTFLWQKYHLKIVYLAMEPAVLKVIEPRIRELIQYWEYPIEKPFLIIVQNDSIRFWQ